MKKKIIITTIIALLLVGSYGIGNYFVNFALTIDSSSLDAVLEEDNDKTPVEIQIENNREIENQIAAQFKTTLSQTTIKSDDDLKLAGNYIEDQSNHLWAIMIHGYKGNSDGMMSYGAQYHKRGYNVLLPDNRAHGQSEGEYIGMGWLDKDDIENWIDWIVSRDSEAKIVVHGVSMGGATTMMLAGDNYHNVVGYIEDCGYTSVWDIFKSELDKQFSLPTFPVLDMANIVANNKVGYDFSTASSVNQVKKSNKPILFIHGGKDDFVPTSMVYECYEACKAPKDLYVVDEAEHATSKNYDPEAYYNYVFNFIDNKILNKIQ